MNIAIISHSAGGGGAERVAVNLANHLLNENEVFFCAVHSDRREYYLDPKVQYDYIGTETSLDKGTQRKTTENELPSLTQCTA